MYTDEITVRHRISRYHIDPDGELERHETALALCYSSAEYASPVWGDQSMPRRWSQHSTHDVDLSLDASEQHRVSTP